MCGLCSARTPLEKHVDYEIASAAAEAHAARLGFVKLPDVHAIGGRVRYGQTICADCVADVVAESAPAVPS